MRPRLKPAAISRHDAPSRSTTLLIRFSKSWGETQKFQLRKEKHFVEGKYFPQTRLQRILTDSFTGPMIPRRGCGQAAA